MNTQKNSLIDQAVDQPTPISKRLLLISDVPERLQRLGATLGFEGVELTRATSAEDIARACAGDHDLAVVDVSPGALAKVLGTVRASASLMQIPLLVEASRMSLDPVDAGLLPRHRAMACNLDELKALVRERVSSFSARWPGKDSSRNLI